MLGQTLVLGAGYARRWLGSARGMRIVDAVAGTALVAMETRRARAHRQVGPRASVSPRL